MLLNGYLKLVGTFLALTVLALDSLALGAPLVHCAVHPVSFDASRAYTDTQGPTGVAIGDFNHDGLVDLATSENGAVLGVGFLKNITAGGVTKWAAPVQTAIPNGVKLEAIAPAVLPATPAAPASWTPHMDLNHDGIDDVAVADNAGGVWVMLGATPTPFFQGPLGFAVKGDERDISYGDFNGDGWFDLITADGLKVTSSVLINKKGNPWAGFNPFFVVNNDDAPVTGVTVGDFNCDGVMDFASLDATAGELDIFYGNGVGFVGPIEINVNPDGVGIAAGDFNCDGAIDVATVYDGSTDIYIVYNNQLVNNVPTCGQWTNSMGLPSTVTIRAAGGISSIAAADVDGDGASDLVAGQVIGVTPSVAIFKSLPTAACPIHGNALNGWEAETQVAVPAPAAGGVAGHPTYNGLAIGDLNGDNKLDIAMVNAGNSNNVDVLLNTCN